MESTPPVPCSRRYNLCAALNYQGYKLWLQKGISKGEAWPQSEKDCLGEAAPSRSPRREFDRLRKTGLNFTAKLLEDLARQPTISSTPDEYFLNFFDTLSRKITQDVITLSWIQTLTERDKTVSCAQTGKLMVSPEKQASIEKEVAYHLGFVAREFRSGRLDEDNWSNADETHFVINMDNHQTLVVCDEAEVNNSDVVAGEEEMTMIVRISGERDAII